MGQGMNTGGMNLLSSMLGNNLNKALTNTMSGLGNINSALFQQMGVSNRNPFMGQQAAPSCPKTAAKLNCMAPPSETTTIDAMFMLNTPKMCEVKGCCWDQGLMQQLLLARKSDNIHNIQQFQCPWRAPTVGSKWGLPDLSESLKGCCSISPCVHTELPAEWTLWGEWTQCTKLCGGGESIRSRSCIGNGFCPGMVDDTMREDVVTRPCNQKACEGWSLWAPWGQCSATCGVGTHQRFRSCTDIQGMDVAPPGVSGGCRGNDQSSQACKLQPCPEWGHWRQWSQCSATCGIGMRQRQRMCNLPGQCLGENMERVSCGQACWAPWNNWSECTKSCYGGRHTRSRDCLFQAETGKTCSGQSTDEGKCNDHFCESWVMWQPWSACSDGSFTCGAGTRLRVRECTGTMGAPGCQGEPLEQLSCNMGTCLWSEWAQASVCSKTCGEGLAYYQRTCSRPGQCPGVDKKQLTCVQQQCPGFQEWSTWSECSVTCGSGRTTRTRECNGQINVDCRGSLDQAKACIKTACPHKYGVNQNPYQTQNTYQQTPNSLYNLLNRGNTQNNNYNQNSNQQLFNQMSGSSTTNNQGWYNQVQANPWGAVFDGFAGGNAGNQNQNLGANQMFNGFFGG